MRTLLAIVGKDLRLLWRDRAGLIFLTMAPIMVITVAGFSLANLYGADPTGQTAYDLPFVDEDGGAFARALRERLTRETTVMLHPIARRSDAEDLVRRKRAGSAVVIPAGTEAALTSGQPASVILYTDAAKYLERLNVRARLLELRHQLSTERAEAVRRDAEAQRQRLEVEAKRIQSASAEARRQLDEVWQEARRARDHAATEARRELARAREQVEVQVQRAVGAAADQVAKEIAAQIAELRRPVRSYLEALRGARTRFDAWLGELRRLAGSHAADLPPPPEFPEVPDALARALDEARPLQASAPHVQISLPSLAVLEPPALPAPPELSFPSFELPDLPPVPGALEIQEINLSGGPATINTFDQNVPGFSITFLLLGILLGVSVGLLDERDWGTFDRLRAMPIAAANILIGKLLSRFLVGVIQMLALFAAGWLLFDVSLGPQPAALLLPTIGIVFAGTAFGLVVAAVASSREAVMPVGSIVIVTMAAVGGCWWPIDLEPRWMRTVALAFPTTWAMDAFNDLMIRRRTSDAALWPTAVMLAYGLLYLVVGVQLFQYRLRRRL